MDWPPANRRSRTTRREQNLALLSAVASGAVIAVALVLLLLSRSNPETGARLRGTAIDVAAPIWSVVRVPFDALGAGADWVGDYFAAVSRNRILQAQNAAQAHALQQQAAVLRENAQLKALLKVVEPGPRVLAVARIAGASSGGVVRSALISAGHDHGLAPGQPVRVADGLVGRTLETGNHSARVLLLTDVNSRVPVLIERTGQPALAIGNNGGLLEVRDRVGAEVPLVAGDRLITSGDGGIFAPGIPVAVVVNGKAEPPLARPFVNPLGLGLVLVETPYLPVPTTTETPHDSTPIPREAGGSRPKPMPASTSPRAVASAPSATPSSAAPAGGAVPPTPLASKAPAGKTPVTKPAQPQP